MQEEKKMIKHVLILMAMMDEAKPLIERENLTPIAECPWPASMPMRAFQATRDNLKLTVVVNGECPTHKVANVATTPAAVSAYASVTAFKPDLVISAGTCGGFQAKGAAIGKVYFTDKCVFHARRIPLFPAYENYGVGRFESVKLPKLAEKIGCEIGTCTTSDSLDFTPEEMKVMLAENATVKEMEAAAIAWTCEQLQAPFLALKSVTDIVDQEERTAAEQFVKNLQMASEKLQEKLGMIIGAVGDTEIESWQ